MKIRTGFVSNSSSSSFIIISNNTDINSIEDLKNKLLEKVPNDKFFKDLILEYLYNCDFMTKEMFDLNYKKIDIESDIEIVKAIWNYDKNEYDIISKYIFNI